MAELSFLSELQIKVILEKMFNNNRALIQMLETSNHMKFSLMMGKACKITCGTVLHF